MQENKGQIVRGAVIGLALVAGAFLFIKLRKNKNPKNIYKQLQKTLGWPTKLEKLDTSKYLSWAKKPVQLQYIYKSFTAGDKMYRVFVWENGMFFIKEYDKAKKYPIYVSGKLEMIYPLVLNVLKPANRKGEKFKAKDMTTLLNRLTGTEISYVTKGKA